MSEDIRLYEALRDATRNVLAERYPSTECYYSQGRGVVWYRGERAATLCMALWPGSSKECAVVNVGPGGVNNLTYLPVDARPEYVAWLIFEGLMGSP